MTVTLSGPKSEEELPHVKNNGMHELLKCSHIVILRAGFQCGRLELNKSKCIMEYPIRT
jgi:hypothetical protein